MSGRQSWAMACFVRKSQFRSIPNAAPSTVGSQGICTHGLRSLFMRDETEAEMRDCDSETSRQAHEQGLSWLLLWVTRQCGAQESSTAVASTASQEESFLCTQVSPTLVD